MTTKQLINSNNGNGKLNNSASAPYFSVRILVTDAEAYEKVTDYLMEEAKKVEASEKEVLMGRLNYVLDREGKQIARAHVDRRIIELTGEVKPGIKSEIEKIVMRYST